MKKLLFVFTAIIFSLNSYSQISFEKGYYIDYFGKKIECLIKNIDWRNNPTEFEYKLSENSDSKKGNTSSVKEFGIYNISKYSTQTVDIDESSDKIGDLGSLKKSVFTEKQIFLKVLVEGKANLYSYVKGNLYRYFYNKDNSKVTQLIYKRYLTTENKIGKNSRYKQQLWNDLKCPTISLSRIENIDYKKKELVNFFVKYNTCNDQDFVNFEAKQKKDLFKLNIRAGLNSSSLSIKNSNASSLNTDFGNSIGLRIGVEAEYILPFNKNKWSLIAEPTYQNYNTKKEINTYSAEVNYTSIELPIGVRHYLFLNDNSKVFFNGSYVFDFASNSEIDFDSATDLDIKSNSNLALGLGYMHNDKYSLEVRYQTSRDLLNNFVFWSSDFNTLSIIFGYSIF